MHKQIFLTSLLAILCPPAFADDAHFPAPPRGAPVTGSVAPVAPNRVVDCNNKAALSKSLTDYRLLLRKEYATKVAQAIPQLGLQSPVNGVSCIHSSEAFDSAYNPADDSFTLTCLAHSRIAMNGRMEDVFSHILQLHLKADPACLSQAGINDFVKGTQCLMPGGYQIFAQGMRNCVTGLERDAASGLSPPSLMGAPLPYSIDGAWYNALLQNKPSVGNIISEDRRIKGSVSSPIAGRSGSAGSSEGDGADEECAKNRFNCSTTLAK
jgi:hypothetical protein